MITIKDQDFEMKQVKNLPFFDLIMPAVINEGKDNERVDMKIVGYAMPFEACIKEVIAYRLGQTNETYTIAKYFHDFQIEVNKICSLIEFTEPVSKKKKDEEDDSEEISEEEVIDDNT